MKRKNLLQNMIILMTILCYFDQKTGLWKEIWKTTIKCPFANEDTVFGYMKWICIETIWRKSLLLCKILFPMNMAIKVIVHLKESWNLDPCIRKINLFSLKNFILVSCKSCWIIISRLRGNDLLLRKLQKLPVHVVLCSYSSQYWTWSLRYNKDHMSLC